MDNRIKIPDWYRGSMERARKALTEQTDWSDTANIAARIGRLSAHLESALEFIESITEQPMAAAPAPTDTIPPKPPTDDEVRTALAVFRQYKRGAMSVGVERILDGDAAPEFPAWLLVRLNAWHSLPEPVERARQTVAAYLSRLALAEDDTPGSAS